jgi:hypothetical protein
MADDDWTEESRFESRSGDRRKGFDFESFILDILRHHAPFEWTFGPYVKVISPPELRAEAVSRLEKARARYR